jgi:sialate O-acetylesterase
MSTPWSNGWRRAGKDPEPVEIKTTVRKLLLILLFAVSAAHADVSLPRLLGDGVILQRDSNARLWGWADDGERIEVRLDGELLSVASAAGGRWEIELPARAAGGPHKIVIRGNNEVTVEDVYFGDVWIASGQSNMELPMERVKERYGDDIAQANFPTIRQFKVTKTYDFDAPHEDLDQGNWVAATPETVLDFSAVAFFFARSIQQTQDVPIGIINSSYGGSPAEAWMSEEALEDFPHYLETAKSYSEPGVLQALLEADRAATTEWNAQLDRRDRGLNGDTPWSDPTLDDSDWWPATVPGYWSEGLLEAINGAMWFRRTIDIPETLDGLPAKLMLGRIVDADTTFVNGIEVGNTTYQYPPRRYDIEPGILRGGKNVFAVRVVSHAGLGGFVPDKNYELIVADTTIDLTGDWRQMLGADSKPMPEPQFRDYRQPLGIYNAMLAPLQKFRIKGAIWYQGETNVDRAGEYETLFPAMIRAWREQWEQGDFPFIYVQLANWLEARDEPVESQLAELRDAQLMALSEPATAMAVTIDVGEWNDIHPLNKKTVGERVALGARGIAYGEDDIVFSGPMYESMEVEGGTVVLEFDHVGGGLVARGGELQGFSLAGTDGRFYWADAVIDGDVVRVHSEEVTEPFAVRYAWADNPDTANLYNKEGLPASPFEASAVKNPDVAAERVSFDWFHYEGRDAVYAGGKDDDEYWNPVVAGFYPDPSAVRVDNDYYLVMSSFAYFPGLPLFHSRDLVNWKSIGHAISRRSQVQWENGENISRGIFAPTIRYHEELFYIITTDIDGIGNFIITAEDPAGPWSDPLPLPEIRGIDPDIFFDDDGRVYITHNGEPEGEALYDGHRAIWIWEFDLQNQRVLRDSGRLIVNGGTDLAKKPIWIEAPHIYKVGDWYYLSCAEGGTADQHSQVVFRTRSLEEPFIPFDGNPILTQRDLDPSREYPVTSTGHADFVQTPDGDWWAVFLGIRAYDERFHNTGRETLLLPVRWENDWPIILDAGTRVPYKARRPALDPINGQIPPQAGNFVWRDEFDQPDLDPNWLRLRTSSAEWIHLNAADGSIELDALPIALTERAQPAFLARRQQHGSFTAATSLETTLSPGTSAGIAIYQSANFHYFLGIRNDKDSLAVVLEEVRDGRARIVANIVPDILMSPAIELGIEQDIDRISFYFADDSNEKVWLARDLDARLLSTQLAGGFVGVTLGMHARRDGARRDAARRD